MLCFHKYREYCYVVLIVCFIMISGRTLADDSAFKLNTSLSVFGCDERVSYLDIYYELYPSQWTYVESTSQQKTATVLLDLRIFENQNEIYATQWGMQEIQENEETGPENVIKMDLMRLKVPPGTYEIHLKSVDLNDKTKADQIQMPIQIPEINKQQVNVSSVLLCQEVRKKKTDDIELFIRDSLFVLPKINKDFNSDNAALKFYLEVENLSQAIPEQTYTIRYYVLDQNDIMIQEIPMFEVRRRANKNTVAQYGTISLSKIRTGSYSLNVVLDDSSGNTLAHKKIAFQMSNPDLVQAEDESYFAGLPITDLHVGIPVDEELEYIQYIIKPEEAKILKQTHDEYGRKKFLEGFWNRRDPDPETIHNKYRDDYLARVTEANVNFGKSGNGWRTDMGRVYVLYGGPNDIQRRLSNSTGRPYQIWRYDEIQGGVEFVFIDLTGVGGFQLVHSTLRGEIQDYEWERLLEVSNLSPSSINHPEILD